MWWREDVFFNKNIGYMGVIENNHILLSLMFCINLGEKSEIRMFYSAYAEGYKKCM